MAAETIIAFDYGKLRVGVAVGNSVSRDAQPLAIIADVTRDGRFQHIARLLAEWRPARLVVGRPVHADGSDTTVTAACERFARQLEGRFNLPVVAVDERYSSIEARDQRSNNSGRRHHRNDPVDDEAAAILLRQYWSEREG